MEIAILRHERADSIKKWQLACEKKGLKYDIINLSRSNWLEKVMEKPYDFFLLRPPGNVEHYKNLYDERTYIIARVLKLKVFPSYEECYIYENKRLLSYFLKAMNIPHPQTNVFYNKEEALKFIEASTYPIVGKTAIGASGSGVKIIKNLSQAKIYINKAFSSKGLKRRFGPNRVIGSPKKWTEKTLINPQYFLKKLKGYLFTHKYGQKDFVIFQEYIHHDFEWRAVKIGDSYFAHKKIKSGEMASGSKGIEYVNPPKSILDFIRKISAENNFNSMAFDIFEDKERGFLVNELQTTFGHVQDYILEVDGVPGRYVYQGNNWIFEPGDFNSNESYDLRLEAAIELFKKNELL